MKIFLVFDSPSFLFEILEKNCRQVDIFPLTADWDDINLVMSRLRDLYIENNLLNSAETVNNEISLNRDKFIEYAAAIGNFKIKEKSLHKWFLLADKNVSAWWFGLLADKDPFKNSAFLRIAQIGAILKEFKNCKSDIIVLALKDYEFQKIMKLILEDHGIRCKGIKVQTGNSISKKIKNHLKRRRIIQSLYTIVKILISMICVKKIMPPLKNRKKIFNNALLIFTYFPSVIKEDALMGRFRNRFAIPLQDVCLQNKKPIAWVASYGSYDNYSLEDAVGLAKKFIENGENIFFYLEFLGLKNLLKALLEYIRIALRWRIIRSRLNHNDINRITGNSYVFQFLLEALDDSFYGNYSLMGIIQYEAFKDMFKSITGFSHGLYFCEMMGWEYALVAAKRFCKIKFPIIGYQHSSVLINQLQYFHSREELKNQNSADGIPLPEILASNGEIPQTILMKYYDKVVNLEALRYLYLNEYLEERNKIVKTKNEGKFILMVCTSIEPDESKTLASLIKAAYPKIDEGLEIWFKGHPALPVQRIFEEVGISERSYEVKGGHISTLLNQSDAVLVGGSSVAIEALAFGCDVLVYLNAETLNQSPFNSFNNCYYKVYDPRGLRSAINDIRSKKKPHDIEKKQNFVKEYWNLNPNLDGWKRILKLDLEVE